MRARTLVASVLVAYVLVVLAIAPSVVSRAIRADPSETEVLE